MALSLPTLKNPKDRFSHEAHIKVAYVQFCMLHFDKTLKRNKPHHDKICLCAVCDRAKRTEHSLFIDAVLLVCDHNIIAIIVTVDISL